MGIYHSGLPVEFFEFFKRTFNLQVFIETGTYTGETAKNMSRFFNLVYTIEKSDLMYEKAKANLTGLDNVFLLKGDSRELLPEIVDKHNNILFWLDAHWSGGDTYGENDECPLMKELDIIFSVNKSVNKNYVIFIDDARLFLSPPPIPHKYEQWPSIKMIIKRIPPNFDVLIFKDIIFIFPINEKFPEVKSYFQKLATDEWIAYSKKNNRFTRKVIRKIKTVLNKWFK